MPNEGRWRHAKSLFWELLVNVPDKARSYRHVDTPQDFEFLTGFSQKLVKHCVDAVIIENLRNVDAECLVNKAVEAEGYKRGYFLVLRSSGGT